MAMAAGVMASRAACLAAAYLIMAAMWSHVAAVAAWRGLKISWRSSCRWLSSIGGGSAEKLSRNVASEAHLASKLSVKAMIILNTMKISSGSENIASEESVRRRIWRQKATGNAA